MAQAYGDAAWGISNNTLPHHGAQPGCAAGLGQDSGGQARRGDAPASGTGAALQVQGDTTSGQGIEQLASMYPQGEKARHARQFSRIITDFNQSVPALYGAPRNNSARRHYGRLRRLP